MDTVTKEISKKYGKKGVDVYNLIDGKRTCAEIAKKTKTSSTELVEMIQFMETSGIVALRF